MLFTTSNSASFISGIDLLSFSSRRLTLLGGSDLTIGDPCQLRSELLGGVCAIVHVLPHLGESVKAQESGVDDIAGGLAAAGVFWCQHFAISGVVVGCGVPCVIVAIRWLCVDLRGIFCGLVVVVVLTDLFLSQPFLGYHCDMINAYHTTISPDVVIGIVIL